MTLKGSPGGGPRSYVTSEQFSQRVLQQRGGPGRSDAHSMDPPQAQAQGSTDAFVAQFPGFTALLKPDAGHHEVEGPKAGSLQRKAGTEEADSGEEEPPPAWRRIRPSAGSGAHPPGH